MRTPLLFKIITTTKCRNPSLNGVSGIVVDETQKTIRVLTPEGAVKTIIKEDCWFYVEVGNCTYLVNGRKLITEVRKGKFLSS